MAASASVTHIQEQNMYTVTRGKLLYDVRGPKIIILKCMCPIMISLQWSPDCGGDCGGGRGSFAAGILATPGQFTVYVYTHVVTAVQYCTTVSYSNPVQEPGSSLFAWTHIVTVQLYVHVHF